MDENAQAPRRSRRAPSRARRWSVRRCSRRRGPRRSASSASRIILSAKVSAVQDLITVYRMLAERSDYALHLGLTEAGMGSKGIVASVGRARRPAAGGPRRHDPHFADARAGRRPHAGSASRAGAPADDGLSHLRAAGRRLPRLRAHDLDGVPGARARHSEPSRRRRCRSGAASIPASSVSTSR